MEQRRQRLWLLLLLLFLFFSAWFLFWCLFPLLKVPPRDKEQLWSGSARAVWCAAHQSRYLTKSRYTNTGPTSPNSLTPGDWQSSHKSSLPIFKSLVWLGHALTGPSRTGGRSIHYRQWRRRVLMHSAKWQSVRSTYCNAAQGIWRHS